MKKPLEDLEHENLAKFQIYGHCIYVQTFIGYVFIRTIIFFFVAVFKPFAERKAEEGTPLFFVRVLNLIDWGFCFAFWLYLIDCFF